MKYLISFITLVIAFNLAATVAIADGTKLSSIADNTAHDFNTLKRNFRKAYRAGHDSWESYGSATGFSVDNMEWRINARRMALKKITREADTIKDASYRGLLKMVANDLDDINISMLALIRSDRGYAGYMNTDDRNGLVNNVSSWQDGVRQSLKGVNRSIKMLGSVKKASLSKIPKGKTPSTL